MSRAFISLTSDFGVQTQGVGLMRAVALSIAPEAHIIDLMHGLPPFDVTAAARTMESVQYLPVGSHVCVCDPGVGTSRKAIVCETARGDFLIGPDNGVLLPAAQILGGALRAHEILNRKYMREPVSPIFHGRDIFAPAAAHLATGVPIGELGPLLDPKILAAQPYEEAYRDGNMIIARIIQINRFGSLHLNVSHALWDGLNLSSQRMLRVETQKHGLMQLSVCRTFGDVPNGCCLILKDDYGRVEIAKNLGSFVKDHPLDVRDEVIIHLDVSQ